MAIFTKPAGVGLPPRVGSSVPTFGQEDKFQTCLNLTPLIDALEVCNQSNSWEEYCRNQDRNDWISGEAMQDFERANYTPIEVSRTRVSPLLPAFIHNLILGDTILVPSVASSIYRSLQESSNKISKINFYIQFDHLTSCCLGGFKDLLMRDYNVWPTKFDNFPRQVLNSFAVLEDLQLVLNKFKTAQHFIHGRTPEERAEKRQRMVGDTFPLRSLHGSCTVMKDFVIIVIAKEEWLVPFVYFLEIYNKVAEMSCLLLYLHMVTGTSMPANHWESSLKFLKCCGTILTRQRPLDMNVIPKYRKVMRDNQGFTVMKTMEPIGVGIMSHREDKEAFAIENRLLLDTMWSALQAENLVSEDVVDDSDLCRILKPLETPQVSDLIGVVKVFGHPIIDIVGGLQKLDERVHKLLEVDNESLQRCLGIMVRDLVLNYYRRHKMYPLLDQATLTPTMQSLVSNSIDILSGPGALVFHSITMQEWANVRFGKNAMFDKADNQFDLIKDKALGIARSNVLKSFLLPISKRSRVRPETRRALLAFLLTPDFTQDFQEYLNSYMKGDDFDDTVLEYLVIKLTAKELELKIQGRFFGASPMQERIRRQVQEKNVMDTMSRYVPEQLLTASELDAMNKLTTFRRLSSAFPDHTLVHVSADFSAWNNNFRRDTVDRSAGVVLDSWFGLNSFYKKTMLAFERMLVYYDDRNYRIYWDGQLGGIEGKSNIFYTISLIPISYFP